MVWLQENYVIAVVGLVVAVVLLWFLFGRKKAEDVAPTFVPPAEPKKPLEPVKPEIIAAEPARFKPVEPIAPPSRPVAEPVAKAPPPKAAATPEPAPAPAPERAPAPAPISTPKPAEPAAVAPEEPTSPPPAPQPVAAKADNLQLLKGVGPKLVTLLAGLGITRFEQVAAWTDADIAAIDPQLGAFQGRIVRDNWIDQAGYLARGDKPGFEGKYGALGGEL